jgi:DNA-binding transcriptional LysR family regulator
MITLKQLKIFEKVASTGHVTKASEELFLTQSAVSMAIAELERFAEAPLFHRQGKKLILNDRGRMILENARDILQKAGTIERLLKESADEPSGTLHVGASTTIGNYLLPTIVGSFSKQCPKGKAVLHVGNSEQVEAAVEKGAYDIGLIEGPSHHPALLSKIWQDDKLVVIVAKEHPWALKGRATAKMLSTASWIMREKGSGTRETFEAAMAKKNIAFQIAMELGHTEKKKKGVEAGLGVSCFSRMAVTREINAGWLAEISTPLDLKRKLMIVTRQNSFQTKLFKAFLDTLEKI